MMPYGLQEMIKSLYTYNNETALDESSDKYSTWLCFMLLLPFDSSCKLMAVLLVTQMEQSSLSL